MKTKPKIFLGVIPSLRDDIKLVNSFLPTAKAKESFQRVMNSNCNQGYNDGYDDKRGIYKRVK